MDFLEKVSETLPNIVLLLVTPIVTIFAYPILISVFIPVWIFRKLVNIVVHLLDPQLGNILTAMDALYAGPDPYKKAVQIVATCCTLKSKLELTKMREIMKNKLFSPDGVPMFPQLAQNIVRRYGYNFWRDTDSPFKLENHTRHLNPKDPDEPVTRSELKHLLANEIPYLPFDPKLSPWEIILVKDFVDEKDPSVKSIVIFHYNHCLMDGFSGVRLTQILSLDPWNFPKQPEPSKLQKTIWKLTVTLAMLLTGPYQILKVFLFTNDHNILFNGKDAIAETKEMGELDMLPMNRIKGVKNKYGVCVSSVLITMAAEATRNMIQLKSGKNCRKIHVMLALPLPDHPEGLTNHWSFIKLPIVFGHNGDLVTTLKNVDREYKKVVNSSVPLLCFYFTRILGILPVWAQGKAEDYLSCSLVMSNFPGPKFSVDLMGCECEETFIAGSAWKGSGIAFTSVAMNEKLRLCSGGTVENTRHQVKGVNTTAIELASEVLKGLEAGILRLI